MGPCAHVFIPLVRDRSCPWGTLLDRRCWEKRCAAWALPVPEQRYGALLFSLFLCGMSTVRIVPPEGPVQGTIHLPRSKSVSNRALIMASLFGDLDAVHDLSNGDDTRLLLKLLRERPAVMHCGAGGTTFRFLLAWAAVQEGEEHLITGIPRLLERPHDDLMNALLTLGADITQRPDGYLVKGRRMPGGAVHFDSPISSQYLSALLLVAPRMEQGIHMRWTGTRLSEPFVHMTLKMLAHFGVFPVMELDGVRVPAGHYQPATFTVPPDWSAAAFWHQLVALSPGAQVLLPGLHDDTLQGDREARRLWNPWVESSPSAEGMQLQHRAHPRPWDDVHRPGEALHMRHIPDLFQALAFTLAAKGQAARMDGLDNLRVKETDRLRSVHEALAAMGRNAQVMEGTFVLQDGAPLRAPAAPFDPSIDHRMALSLAPLALVLGPISIHDPRVVDKSYPAFWDHLRAVGFGVE